MRRREVHALLQKYNWQQRDDGLWQNTNPKWWWLFKLDWFRMKVYCESGLPPSGPRLIGWRTYGALYLTENPPSQRPGIIIGPFKRPKGYGNAYYIWTAQPPRYEGKK